MSDAIFATLVLLVAGAGKGYYGAENLKKHKLISFFVTFWMVTAVFNIMHVSTIPIGRALMFIPIMILGITLGRYIGEWVRKIDT